MISKGAVRVQKKNLWQDALYWVLLLALLTAGTVAMAVLG